MKKEENHLSLRFITGRSGAGKTHGIQQEIVEMIQDDPLGKPIIVIVPDQMSYSMEHRLSVEFGLSGIIRAQVLTFKRLAWTVLQEVGGITKQEVDGFGYRMLVKSVLEEHQQEFKLFKKAATKHGFTEQIGDLMKEFSRYEVDDTSMAMIVEQLKETGAPQILIDKAADLQLLLTKVEEKLGDTYVDGEGYLALLCERIQHSDFMKSAHVYIDGFENFTTLEYGLLTEMMKHSKQVTVVLPMEDPHHHDELFLNAQRTYEKIQQLAHDHQIIIEPLEYVEGKKRFKAEALAHLEEQFNEYPATVKPAGDAVKILQAANPRAEMHAVARAIRRLVMEGKRYQDIAILYRQPEKYNPLFQTVFPQYDIPVFVSERKPMLHHPLIEFSRSALEAVVFGWSFEAIFRAVKTDLFFPQDGNLMLWRERADRLENFCLERGIYGSKWFDDRRWFVKRYRGLEFYQQTQTDAERALQQEIDQIRDCIREPLTRLETHLQRAKTGRDIAEALFTFVNQLRVYEKMLDLREREEEAGRLDAASEHEQAWNEWIHLLDQFVLMFGDQELTVEEAFRIFDEGFDTLEFKQIPPSIDQVTATSIDRARLMDIDVVFVLGANEGVLPQRVEHEGLLSDTEREAFAQIGYELAPTSKMRLMDELFIAYRAFTSAREKLFVSYSIADEEGKGLFASPYIARIQQILTNCEVIPAVLDPTELPEDAHRMEYITHPRATLPFAAMKLQLQETESIASEWQAVIHYYMQDPLWSSLMSRIIKPVKSSHKTERLTPVVTEELYGKTFLTSVSRIESYYSCPFQHFASHGLKLGEREEYTLEAPQIGDLFHAVLKWVADELKRVNMSWHDVTKEQSWALARQAVEEITPYFFNKILLSTNRYVYIQRKLTQIVQRTILSMSTQASRSAFSTVAVEQGFGPGESLPSLRIPLKNGQELQLQGRIDRIDVAEIDGKKFLRVVDYKSSEQNVQLAEVYYGLSLQMLTYLDVALSNSDKIIGVEADPAGFLYLQVHNPMIQADETLSQEKLEEEILKSYKMQGYVVDQPNVVEQMDTKMEKSSPIIPATFKKDGTFTKYSKVLDTEELQMMRQFVRSKHEQAGNGMTVGDTRVYPYKLKDRMPCQYCAYRSICQFDETDPNHTYRSYELFNETTSLEKMREEIEADEHSS